MIYRFTLPGTPVWCRAIRLPPLRRQLWANRALKGCCSAGALEQGGGVPGKPVSQNELGAWLEQLTDAWCGWDGMRAVAELERPRTEHVRAMLQQIFAEHGP
jgi:hypothetical protein